MGPIGLKTKPPRTNQKGNMQKNRLLWGSRRGMLELDLMLEPFVHEAYPSLDEEDQLRYQALLEEQDQDLFTWLMSRQDPEDPNLLRIVSLVREHARNRKRQY